ncbi:hypothetical protein ACFYPC_08470 [Streptomyces sp. NPDC005808]|uniref:SCO2400 family protein n=1 Tax=Streptomyces sp. NPDC005808 TaxID=3364734 RepID=UPI00368276E2
MDYCLPCHRHLNGALACPGCGTPAEKVREHADAVQSRPETDDDVDDGHEGDDTRPRGRRRGSAAGGGSRRDRKAAAHRRRRRGALIVGAGLFLAAGGLSLAELGVDAPGANPQAATADESPEGGTSTPAETALPLEDDPTGSGSSDASAGASPSASESPSPSASVSASESAADEGENNVEGSASTITTPQTSAPASTTPTETSQPPSADPTSADPTPEPSPSDSCDQFLWWCT